MNVYYIAAAWMGLAFVAAVLSVRLGISVALVEVVVGAVAGNLPGSGNWLAQTEFTAFLASLGSVLLTFLAGAEIDPVSLRQHWKPSLAIGVASFGVPAAGAFAFCYFAFDWTLPAAEVGGVALSTTSVAVVYAVLVETGLNREEVGKLILAACFVTDLGTLLALGGLFAPYGWLLAVFGVVGTATLIALPRATRAVIDSLGHRMSEPEVKFLLCVLLGLGGLATAAGSEAVLPAYVAGLAVAGVFAADRMLSDRLRAMSFALLTPFFFLRAGTLISFPALWAGAGVIALLFLVKMATKIVGVWPTAAAFGIQPKTRAYTTLLMATGLTFGSISALYGLEHGLIDHTQYSELVTVVILSAIVPTLIAQRFFAPSSARDEHSDALSVEDAGLLPRRPAARTQRARRDSGM